MEQSTSVHALDKGVSGKTSATLSKNAEGQAGATDLGGIPPSRDCPPSVSSSPKKSEQKFPGKISQAEIDRAAIDAIIFGTGFVEISADGVRHVPARSVTGDRPWCFGTPLDEGEAQARWSRERLIDEAVRRHLSATWPGTARTIGHMRRCGYCRSKVEDIRAEFRRLVHVEH